MATDSNLEQEKGLKPRAKKILQMLFVDGKTPGEIREELTLSQDLFNVEFNAILKFANKSRWREIHIDKSLEIKKVDVFPTKDIVVTKTVIDEDKMLNTRF